MRFQRISRIKNFEKMGIIYVERGFGKKNLEKIILKMLLAAIFRY